MSSNPSRLKIKFSKKMQKITNLKDKINIQIRPLVSSTDFSYDVIKISNEEFVVDLEYKVTLIKKQIIVVFTQRESLLDTWNNELATS